MTLTRVVLLLLVAVVFSSAARAEDRGRVVYERWCQACHGTGPDKPGTGALQAKYKGALPAVLDERKDLTPDLVRMFVRRGVSVMPPFRKTEITDAELDALAAYLAKTAP